MDSNLLIDLLQINTIRCTKDKANNGQGQKLMGLIKDFLFDVRGNSLRDFFICLHSILIFVYNIKIVHKPYFDHMPLKLIIWSQSLVQRNRINWSAKNAPRYRQHFNQHNLKNLLMSLCV